MLQKPTGNFRVISHLSIPEGRRVKDGIDDYFTLGQDTTFGKVIDMVAQLGKGAFLEKWI